MGKTNNQTQIAEIECDTVKNHEAKTQVIKAWETVSGSELVWERWLSLWLSFLLFRSLAYGAEGGKAAASL